jgi:hypothetical protein
LIEFGLKEIIAHRFSINVSVHPNFVFYRQPGYRGSRDPAAEGLITAGIGIKYSFRKAKPED